MGWDSLTYKSYWLRDHFLLVAQSDHTTGSRNIKPGVVVKVQKMARYPPFCLIMGLFKGEVPVFARLWSVRLLWRAPRCRLTLTETRNLAVARMVDHTAPDVKLTITLILARTYLFATIQNATDN